MRQILEKMEPWIMQENLAILWNEDETVQCYDASESDLFDAGMKTMK